VRLAGLDVLPDEARRAIGLEILSGESGLAALDRYAGWIDAEIVRLHAAPGPPAKAVALAALGGYGRRHLCPYSDIDLLILFGGPVGDAEERFLRRLLHPLWDAGFIVGHQVRERDDLARLEADNPEFLLALSDARLVAGDSMLFEETLAATGGTRSSTERCINSSRI
jgi:[protein-PII] uridylyltransferase